VKAITTISARFSTHQRSRHALLQLALTLFWRISRYAAHAMLRLELADDVTAKR
jgi:hypothetical protein